MKGYGATEGEKTQCRTCKGTGRITKQDKEVRILNTVQ